MTIKPNKKNPNKPGKHATALITFTSLEGAFAAVTASDRAEMGLKGVQISWAENKEPESVIWLRENDLLGAPTQAKIFSSKSSSSLSPGTGLFSSFPGDLVSKP